MQFLAAGCSRGRTETREPRIPQGFRMHLPTDRNAQIGLVAVESLWVALNFGWLGIRSLSTKPDLSPKCNNDLLLDTKLVSLLTTMEFGRPACMGCLIPLEPGGPGDTYIQSLNIHSGINLTTWSEIYPCSPSCKIWAVLTPSASSGACRLVFEKGTNHLGFCENKKTIIVGFKHSRSLLLRETSEMPSNLRTCPRALRRRFHVLWANQGQLSTYNTDPASFWQLTPANCC